MEIRKILLPTDLSEESERAFGPIGDLAREKGASVTLLNVVYDPGIAPHGAPLAPPAHAPDVEEMRIEAEKGLEGLRKKLPGDLKIECHALVGSEVARTVAAFAEEHGHDLIALSSHGRSGFRRLVLGSVAEAVLRHAQVPVLVFPRQS